jgi:hypothetical protein
MVLLGTSTGISGSKDALTVRPAHFSGKEIYSPRHWTDVINVSGHRLSTAEIESALILHNGVAETAGEITLTFSVERVFDKCVTVCSHRRRRRFDRAGCACLCHS